jgi:hypothetical protein
LCYNEKTVKKLLLSSLVITSLSAEKADMDTRFIDERKSSIWEFPILHVYTYPLGRAIAQAVSRWLPTAVAQVQTHVRSCGICGGQSSTGAGFLRVLWFPLPTFISPVAPQSPSSII